jgi:hypothetical protein
MLSEDDISQELLRCPRCGIHEPACNFVDRICKECQKEGRQQPTATKNTSSVNTDVENPYLLLGFWEFAILSTLMVVFFPWSLLFCWLFFGMDTTVAIVLALIHDAYKTFLALLAAAAVLGTLIIGLMLMFAQ